MWVILAILLIPVVSLLEGNSARTQSISPALLIYFLCAWMMFKFRRMYPQGSIARGYIAPWHPLPAAVLLLLTIGTLVGMYYGYWVNMVSGFFFYLIASLWFVLHRYRKVDTEKLLQAGVENWPRPAGY